MNTTSLYRMDNTIRDNYRVIPQKNINYIISLFFAVLTLLSSVIVGVGNYTQKTADAAVSGIPMFCGTEVLGGGMETPGKWESAFIRLPASDVSGRTLTAQEAFGSNASFVTYFGEGKGTPWTQEVQNTEQRKTDAKIDDVKEKLEKERNAETCTFGSMMNGLANGTMALSAGIVNTGNFFAVSSFDPTVICDGSSTDKNCIDIAGIVGGKNNSDNGGVIGALTTGLLIPLSTLIAVISAIGILIRNIRSPRQGLFEALWLVLIYVIGLIFAMNATTVATLPIKTAAVITDSVVAPFTKATNANGDTTTSNICSASAPSATADQAMSLKVSSLTCMSWKSFILNPYSMAEFGRPFEQMDASDPTTAEMLNKAGVSKETITVPLSTTQTLDSMSGDTLKLDGNDQKVSNLVIYQLYLRTNASTNADTNKVGTTPDTRWYNVIAPVAHNENAWNAWAYSASSGFMHLSYAGISLLASGMGMFLISITSLLALVWLFVSMIAIAFLPIFLLIGLEASRGRSVLKSYLKDLGNSLIKYFVSLVFVIVTIILFGAVLGTIENIALMFLAVMIISLALFMFRGRIMGMFGDMSLLNAGSMGGRVGDVLRKSSRQMRSAVGGGIGGALTSENKLSGFSNGIMDTINRDLKRGQGGIPSFLRERDRIREDNLKDVRSLQNDTQERATREQTRAGDFAKEYAQAQARAQAIGSEINGLQSQRDDIVGNVNMKHDVEDNVLMNMNVRNAGGQMFAEQQALKNELSRLNDALNAGLLSGSEKKDAEMRSQEIERELDSKDNVVLPDNVNNDFNNAQRAYEQKLASELSGLPIDALSHDSVQKIVAFNEQITALTRDYASENARVGHLASHYAQAMDNMVKEQAKADVLGDTIREQRPGTGMSSRDVSNLDSDARDNYQNREDELRETNHMSLDELTPEFMLGGTIAHDDYSRGEKEGLDLPNSSQSSENSTPTNNGGEATSDQVHVSDESTGSKDDLWERKEGDARDAVESTMNPPQTEDMKRDVETHDGEPTVPLQPVNNDSSNLQGQDGSIPAESNIVPVVPVNHMDARNTRDMNRNDKTPTAKIPVVDNSVDESSKVSSRVSTNESLLSEQSKQTTANIASMSSRDMDIMQKNLADNLASTNQKVESSMNNVKNLSESTKKDVAQQIQNSLGNVAKNSEGLDKALRDLVGAEISQEMLKMAQKPQDSSQIAKTMNSDQKQMVQEAVDRAYTDKVKTHQGFADEMQKMSIAEREQTQNEVKKVLADAIGDLTHNITVLKDQNVNDLGNKNVANIDDINDYRTTGNIPEGWDNL